MGNNSSRSKSKKQSQNVNKISSSVQTLATDVPSTTTTITSSNPVLNTSQSVPTSPYIYNYYVPTYGGGSLKNTKNKSSVYNYYDYNTYSNVPYDGYDINYLASPKRFKKIKFSDYPSGAYTEYYDHKYSYPDKDYYLKNGHVNRTNQKSSLNKPYHNVIYDDFKNFKQESEEIIYVPMRKRDFLRNNLSTVYSTQNNNRTNGKQETNYSSFDLPKKNFQVANETNSKTSKSSTSAIPILKKEFTETLKTQTSNQANQMNTFKTTQIDKRLIENHYNYQERNLLTPNQNDTRLSNNKVKDNLKIYSRIDLD